MIPMQDTPANKFVYTARIQVEDKYEVKLSGNHTKTVNLEDDKKQVSFETTVKIPSYLIALVIGDLKT